MKTYIPFPVIDVVATGRNIQNLREGCNFSVLDVQTYLGLAAPQAIYQWQQGRCLPSVDHLYALSVLFGVTMNEIIVPVTPHSKPAKLSQSNKGQKHKFMVMPIQTNVA